MGSAQLLASKVVIQEEEPRVRSLPALPTAVLAIVGITERGPVGEAKLVTSFDEFIRYFGGDIANSYTIHAVRAYFDNGGQFLYVVRTVHYTNPASPATKTSAKGTLTMLTGATAATAGSVLGSVVGPWDLEPADTLVVAVDGGAPATATFNATAAALECVTVETYNALVNGETLTVKIDDGSVQTIAFLTGEFTPGAATAEEVAAVINAKIVGAQAFPSSGGTRVTIRSDKRGTGSAVEVTGGTANVHFAFSTVPVAGTGNVVNIDSVPFSEVKAIIELAVAGCIVTSDTGRARISSLTTGLLSSIQVQVASTADDEFGFDNAVHSGTTGAAVNTLKADGKYDGAYVNAYTIRISGATSGVASEFNLAIEDGGVVLELFPNLTMLDSAANYVETVVNNENTGSRLLAMTDLDAVAPLEGRPANGLFGPLTGGNDGLVAIADTDFIGSSVGKTGIRALDLKPDVTLLAIPDRATAAVQQAMWQYSEVVREKSIYCLWDPPASTTAVSIITYFETTAALLGATEVGQMVWPRVKVLNPNTSVYGEDTKLTVPPSGHVAGMIARNDNARPGGIYTPPAGVENGRLFGVVDLETEESLDETKRDLVFPKRINPINMFPGSGGYFVDGARTAKADGNFPTTAERRGASYIEQTVKTGLQFARHKNNDKKLRNQVTRIVTVFLLQQMRVGAFRSEKPSEAFFVDFGEGLNPPSEQFANKLNGRIGLATQKPAEFIILSFSQDTRALEEELLTAAR